MRSLRAPRQSPLDRASRLRQATAALSLLPRQKRGRVWGQAMKRIMKRIQRKRRRARDLAPMRTPGRQHLPSASRAQRRGTRPATVSFSATTSSGLAGLRRSIDVAAAETALSQAQAFAAVAAGADWDPGGRTNNPARVERDLRRARNIAQEIDQASARLEAARALRAQLAALGHEALG